MEPKANPKPRPKRPGKRSNLERWLAEQRPQEIGEAEVHAIQQALSPISPSYLRKLLRESGVPLAPIIEGVRQESMASLETSLLTLLNEYEQGDRPRKTAIRKLVIEAKDHAKLAARIRPEKEEMILWMLTWLENPPLFRTWVVLRKAAL